MKKNTAKVSSVKSSAKTAPKKGGVKFDKDWSKLPTSKMLLALVIKSIESGNPMTLPTSKEEARRMLGYPESTAAKAA